MSGGFPRQLGKAGVHRPLQLAERAIEIADTSSKSANAKFCVLLEFTGRLYVERRHNSHASEVVATFDRKSDPDWLADEIAFAAKEWV